MSAAAKPRPHIVEFDFLRVFAAAGVVFIHASATVVSRMAPDDYWNATYLLRMLAEFAVPAFVFMTGALVWTRPPSGGVLGYAQFLSRRLRAIVPAYVLWSAAYWLIAYSGYGWTPRGTGSAEGLGGFLWQLVTGTAWRHLYFVPLIVLVYAITPLAARVLRLSPALSLVGSYILALLWGLVAPAFAGIPGIEVVGRLFAYIPFAVAGAWYALRREDRAGTDAWEARGWPLYLLGGVALQVAYSTGMLGEWPLQLAYLVRLSGVAIIVGFAGAFVWTACRAKTAVGIATALAPLTYAVYLAHPAVLVAYYRLTRIYDMNRLWTQPDYLLVKWLVAFAVAFAVAGGYALLQRSARRLSARRAPGTDAASTEARAA